jgi:hypothetical protein
MFGQNLTKFQSFVYFFTNLNGFLNALVYGSNALINKVQWKATPKLSSDTIMKFSVAEQGQNSLFYFMTESVSYDFRSQEYNLDYLTETSDTI